MCEKNSSWQCNAVCDTLTVLILRRCRDVFFDWFELMFLTFHSTQTAQLGHVLLTQSLDQYAPKQDQTLHEKQPRTILKTLHANINISKSSITQGRFLRSRPLRLNADRICLVDGTEATTRSVCLGKQLPTTNQFNLHGRDVARWLVRRHWSKPRRTVSRRRGQVISELLQQLKLLAANVKQHKTIPAASLPTTSHAVALSPIYGHDLLSLCCRATWHITSSSADINASDSTTLDFVRVTNLHITIN